MSFALEMAMAPRVGLEVSPALVVFGELLTLPCAAMQSVVERGAVRECGAGTSRRRRLPDLPRHVAGPGARCARCRRAVGEGNQFADVADRAATEPDTHALLRAVRMETSAAERADRRAPDRQPRRARPSGPVVRADRRRPGRRRIGRGARAGRRPPLRAARGRRHRRRRVPAVPAGRARARRRPARLTRAVIADHLPALAKGHFTSIAKALGVSRAEVEQVLDLIRRRLRPYPAFDGNAPAVSSYVVPDVVVREHDEIAGAFTVELVEPAVTRLAVRRARPREAEALGVARARSFLGQLRDRWEHPAAGRRVRRRAPAGVPGRRASRRCKPLTRADGRRRARPARVDREPGRRRQVRAAPGQDDRPAVAVLRGQRRGRRGAAASCWSRRTARCRTSASPTAARGRLPDRPADRRQASRASRVHRRVAALSTPRWPGSCCVRGAPHEPGRLRMFEPTQSYAVVLSDVHIGNNTPTCWYQAPVHERQLTEVLNWILARRAVVREVGAARRPVRRLDVSAERAAAVDGRHRRRQPHPARPRGPLAAVVKALPGSVRMLLGNHDGSLTRADVDTLNRSLGGDLSAASGSSCSRLPGVSSPARAVRAPCSHTATTGACSTRRTRARAGARSRSGTSSRVRSATSCRRR